MPQGYPAAGHLSFYPAPDDGRQLATISPSPGDGGIFKEKIMPVNDTDYYKIYDQFTNEERVLKESVRRFLDKEIRPLVLEAFHTEEPLDMRKIAPKMGRMGLIG